MNYTNLNFCRLYIFPLILILRSRNSIEKKGRVCRITEPTVVLFHKKRYVYYVYTRTIVRYLLSITSNSIYKNNYLLDLTRPEQHTCPLTRHPKLNTPFLTPTILINFIYDTVILQFWFLHKDFEFLNYCVSLQKRYNSYLILSVQFLFTFFLSS